MWQFFKAFVKKLPPFNSLFATIAMKEADNAALQADNMALQADNTVLQSNNTALQTDHLALQEECTRIKAVVADVEARGAELQARNAEFEQWNTRLQADNAALQEKLDKIMRSGDDFVSYSSCGEDAIIRAIFFNAFKGNVLTDGFYIDIGAFHPTIASNTKFLHDIGWSGINVEANPSGIEIFKRDRPMDINLNYAIAAHDGMTDFYLFGEQGAEFYGSSSSTSSDFVDFIQQTQNVNANVLQVPAITLKSLFERYVGGKEIHFLDLDIETMELIALESNDWEKFRPLVICVEILQNKIESLLQLQSNPVVQYMTDHGYRFFSVALYSCFFYDTRHPKKNFIECWLDIGL